MDDQKLIFSNDVAEYIDKIVSRLNPSKVFVLVDVNTEAFVLPRLQQQSEVVNTAQIITIKAGDVNKTLDSLNFIWQQLVARGATRNSLMINLGGGVVTDIGAFAAATFKRGISFINVPTSLLGAVDAAVGGKTGINLNNLKNQIGVFRDADCVIVSSTFFNTLNSQELLSGYAEMVKHALLKSKTAFGDVIKSSPEEIDAASMLSLLKESVLVKQAYVSKDHDETSVRRALNLGHTVGHAFETLALERKSPIAHGYAVAYGLVTELVISHQILGFPSDTLHTLAAFVKANYSGFYFDCDDYDRLVEIMVSDKKNHSPQQINFTLLRAIGDPVIDCVIAPLKIRDALDITRDLLAI